MGECEREHRGVISRRGKDEDINVGWEGGMAQ